MSEKIESVEPILDEETMEYIMNSDSSERPIDESDVKKFIKFALKDGDKENYANFIAIIDRFERTNPIFKRLTSLHVEALKLDDTYRKIYREASDSESELSKMAVSRLEWNKKNLK